MSVATRLAVATRGFRGGEGGGGGGPTQYIVVEAFVDMDGNEIEVMAEPLGVEVDVEVLRLDFVADFEDGIAADVVVNRTETIQ